MNRKVCDMRSGRGRAWRWRRALALAAGAALLCAVALWLWPVSGTTEARADFPRLPPHALAHVLADFTNHPKLFLHLGSWTLQEEGGNYTHWWYGVAFACGARCAGRALVRAQQLSLSREHDAPRHGLAPAHRVQLTHRTCSHLPLLSFLSLCEEWEIDSWITQLEGGAGGSRLLERWAARGGWAGGTASLADRAQQRILRLRELLQIQS